jgi:acyl carrier protein
MLNIETQIRNFIGKNLIIDESHSSMDGDQLSTKTTMHSTGSLKELVNFLESAFNIVIQEEDITPDIVESVDKISMFICESLSKQISEVVCSHLEGCVIETAEELGTREEVINRLAIATRETAYEIGLNPRPSKY